MNRRKVGGWQVWFSIIALMIVVWDSTLGFFTWTMRIPFFDNASFIIRFGYLLPLVLMGISILIQCLLNKSSKN